jgi:molybdopterin synthase catalytic subunit
MIELTRQSIDPDRALRHLHSTQAGAVVLFLGTTREFTAGRQTTFLEYDAYCEMAERQLVTLERQARSRWPLIGCAIIHRLGRVDLGEASVLVAVSTPHRPDAFQAAAWLMDQIKQDVPIWKQENWSDGGQAWVHSGINSTGGPAASPADPPKAPTSTAHQEHDQ